MFEEEEKEKELKMRFQSILKEVLENERQYRILKESFCDTDYQIKKLKYESEII